MTINQLIISAQQQRDFVAANYLKKIVLTAETNKISVNDAICYLLTIEKKKYNINLLRLAQKFFPASENKYIKQEKNDEQSQTLNTINVQPKVKEKLGCTLEEILNIKPIIKHRTTNF